MSNTSSDILPPLITIITVVYNGASHIEDTLRSITALQYPNLEYIVIDGGSTDGTIDILKKHSCMISYWISEKDNGVYDAMNKGWRAAKEDSYILFLGAGDKLLSLPNDLTKHGAGDVIFGNVTLDNGRIFKAECGNMLKVRNTLHHQALLVNKSVHPEPPFDTRFKMFADFDFNQRLFKRGVHFVFSDSFIGYALPAGVSGTYDLTEALCVVKKNYGLIWCVLALLYFVARRCFVRCRGVLKKVGMVL